MRRGGLRAGVMATWFFDFAVAVPFLCVVGGVLMLTISSMATGLGVIRRRSPGSNRSDPGARELSQGRWTSSAGWNPPFVGAHVSFRNVGRSDLGVGWRRWKSGMMTS
jgi:hypothetical protein